ncbi:MAG: FAD:protein FMN transferase [Gammaproteobacteria bacterium]|nr:FAD:protein FMN transferase [Gammaproteobacteria bacterium]
MINNRPYFFLLLLPILFACERESLFVISGPTMGTSYTVKIVGEDLDRGKLRSQIEVELQRINGLMSTFDENSELSKFNRFPVSSPFTVSAAILEVLMLSSEIFDHSGGAFDVTVGPLVNLWGFGPEPSRDTVPGDEEIEAAKQRTGFALLQIQDGRLLKKRNIYVDLSAIAKGYAVDQLALILQKEDVTNYLIEIGGELKASGRNDQGNPWTIAVEVPDNLNRSVFRTLELRNISMATSGDYRNYFEVDGERYSHTIDPRTGRPITHNVASVTVLDPSAAIADGYATAINVLGVEEGLNLAQAQNLAVLVIIKTEDGFKERTSLALDVYLNENLDNQRN